LDEDAKNDEEQNKEKNRECSSMSLEENKIVLLQKKTRKSLILRLLNPRMNSG